MSLKPSEYAAWWGAAIATIIGFWDVYKWCRDRPGLSVKVQCPTPTDLNNSAGPLSVGVEVINGQSPLSIRAVSLRHFKSIWHRAIRRPDRTGKLSRSDIPKKLDPADTWSFILDEFDNDFHLSGEDLTNGILLIDLHGTHRTRPVSARLLLKKDQKGKMGDVLQ